MPEGDTIFRAARTLHRALAGSPVTRFESAFPALNRIDDDRPLAGRTIESVSARGKHLLMTFSGDLILRTHMKMHGSWHIYRPGERWQRPPREMRIVVGTADFVAVGFNVPDAEFEAASDVGARDAIASLGPDLLAPDFDAAEAVRRLQARGDMTIAEALLDQRALAGIGNVFKSEVLFEGGVGPFTKVSAIEADRLSALVDIARRQLAANVGASAGGHGRRTTGRLAVAEGLWVYGRGGRPCRRCGTPISFARQGLGARPTYWCPRCQPA